MTSSDRLSKLRVQLFVVPLIICVCLLILQFDAFLHAESPRLQLLDALSQHSTQANKVVRKSIVQLTHDKLTGAFSGTLVSPTHLVTDQYNLSQSKLNRFEVRHIASAILPTSTKPGTKVYARVVARDLRTRIAVLKLEDAEKKPVKLNYTRPQTSKFRRGTLISCFGIGDPKLVTPLANSGIVSAMNRFSGRARQMSCKIDPIFAGGPVFDLNGHLCGVAIVLPQRLEFNSGVSFFIPMSGILSTLPAMADGVDMKPASLKILVPETASDLFSGVPIAKLLPGSPLAGYGIKPGDQIVAIGSQKIRTVNDLSSVLQSLYAGQKVSVTILNMASGQSKTVAVTLAQKR